MYICWAFISKCAPAIAHHHALTPTNGSKKTRNMDHVVVEPVGATFRQNSSNRFYYSSSWAGVNSAQVKSDTWIISNNVILMKFYCFFMCLPETGKFDILIIDIYFVFDSNISLRCLSTSY